MKKLNHNSVKIKWSGQDASLKSFIKRMTPDEDQLKLAFEAVSNPDDKIYSTDMIDNLVKIANEDKTSTNSIVLGEFYRLFKKCFINPSVAKYMIDTSYPELVQSLERCTMKIIKDRMNTSEEVKSLIRYKIKWLLDINRLDPSSKESLRLIGFTEYFISVFTDPTKYIVD